MGLVSPQIEIYASPELGWKCELFDVDQPISTHWHKIQRHIVVVAGGELETDVGQKQVLRAGEAITVEPGVAYRLAPVGSSRFFNIALPGFVYPEDVYEGAPAPVGRWSAPKITLPDLPKVDLGDYAVYNLPSEEAWSVAILEICDSPRHFHKVEKEIFVVIEGSLDIEIEGKNQVLEAGEWIEILPHLKHQLKSTQESPVRVLCFNLPAFDPADMHLA